MRACEIFALLGIKGVGDAAVSIILQYLNDLGVNSILEINFDVLVNNRVCCVHRLNSRPKADIAF